MSRSRSVHFAWFLLAALLPSQAQGQLPIDLDAFAPQTDTFTLEVGGDAIGTQVITVTSVDGGFLIREVTTTRVGSQSTEVRTDRVLAMRSVRQQGLMAGQTMSIDVDYGEGRATGRARVPSAGGMTDLVIDAEVPAEAIDDNILLSVLPAIRWSDGMAFDLSIFASGKNSLVTHTVRASLEALDRPGGPLPAYRVEIEGGDLPLVVHLSQSRPHRLLRLEPVGSPMLVVRREPSGGNDR
jgi:hypothetical protein